MTTPLLAYHEVYKSFDAPVLSGVTLQVTRGERLAIVGPSGTGKSVLLKMAIGLIVPDEGDVFLDGRSVVSASRRELEAMRRKVGYVFQNAALFDSMNVLENVAQGIDEPTLRKLPQRDIVSRVAAALEAVNLDPAPLFTKLPAELSGGMKKRVGLARAIVGHPEILLYDEPVTGLDPVTSAAVTELIARTARQATSILVTHDVEGALDIVERVALLHRGQLVFTGTPDAFRQSDIPLVRAFAHRDAAREAALSMESS